MKTEREVELLLDKVVANIEDYGKLAREYNKERNQELYEYYEKLYGKEIAKHNILLEVLRG